MAKFKVFPYRLHTNGGHVVQVWSEYNSPKDILEFLEDKSVVDIFWTTSTQGNTFVPMILKASCIEIIAPVFGRSGAVVEKDSIGNLVISTNNLNEDVAQQAKVGQSVKKRK